MSESRQVAPGEAIPPTVSINGITFRDGWGSVPSALTGPDALMWVCPELTRAEAEGLAKITNGLVIGAVPWIRNHITGNLPALREKMKREAEEAALPPKPPEYEVVADAKGPWGRGGIMTVEEGECDGCGATDVPVLWADTSSGEYGTIAACAECIGKAFARWAERKAP